VIGLHCDVTVEATLEGQRKDIERFGRIDVLINAGEMWPRNDRA